MGAHVTHRHELLFMYRPPPGCLHPCHRDGNPSFMSGVSFPNLRKLSGNILDVTLKKSQGDLPRYKNAKLHAYLAECLSTRVDMECWVSHENKIRRNFSACRAAPIPLLDRREVRIWKASMLQDIFKTLPPIRHTLGKLQFHKRAILSSVFVVR